MPSARGDRPRAARRMPFVAGSRTAATRVGSASAAVARTGLGHAAPVLGMGDEVVGQGGRGAQHGEQAVPLGSGCGAGPRSARRPRPRTTLGVPARLRGPHRLHQPHEAEQREVRVRRDPQRVGQAVAEDVVERVHETAEGRSASSPRPGRRRRNRAARGPRTGRTARVLTTQPNGAPVRPVAASEPGQVALELEAGDLAAVVVPLGPLVAQEEVEDVLAQVGHEPRSSP